jgi:hypothetical protein
VASGKYPNHPLAIKALPDVVRTGQSRASLINLDDPEQRWFFLLNPQETLYRGNITHVVGGLIGVNQQPTLWISNDGLELQLADLIIDTTAERKSAQAQFERWLNLTKAVANLGRPPLLSFVWGEQSFSQCQITGEYTWLVLSTINGIPVRGRLSFTLKKVGAAIPAITAPTIEPIPTSTNSGGIPIPRPAPTPSPSIEPGVTPSPSPSPGGGVVPADEAALDALGYAAGISLDGASAFAIGSNKVLTAAHMVERVNQTVKLELKGNDGTIEKTVTGTVRQISQNLDAAYIECPANSFSVWWELGDESKLKDGDRCSAYGYPSGGSPHQERNNGLFKKFGSGREGVVFKCISATERLLYPGNSGGAILASMKGHSEYGKIISLTSGGDGRPSKGQSIPNWNTTDECFGPKISEVKAAFNL